MRAPLVASVAAMSLFTVVAHAEEDRWTVDVEAVQLELDGHDRDVLIDRTTGGATPSAATTRLESESALGYRAEVRRAGERWTWGLDFLSHRTGQDAPVRTGAAGAGEQRDFVVGGGGQVTSHGPGEPLYFERLEDTTVELWTLDLHAARALVSRPRSELSWLVGLRAADFDNDYHAIVGLEEVGGLRLDASSNYDRMHGPLVGLVGRFERGRHRFEGALLQSVVWGDVQLSSGVREFVGPPSRDVDVVPGVVAQSRFTTVESVSIPITELRLKWRFALTEHLRLGAGAFASRWWNVAVPPGVVAGTSLDTKDESTIGLFGLSAGVVVAF